MGLVVNLLDALRFNEQAYGNLHKGNKSIMAGALVIGTVGLIYGLSNYILFRHLLTMMSSKASVITGALAIIFSGCSVAFLVHGGIVLLVWAISKGFKGPGNLPSLYGNMGVAMAPLAVGAPSLTYLWLSNSSSIYYLLALPFLAWFWGLMVQAVKAAEGHSYIRASGVLLVTVIFTVSLIYLWLP